MPNGEWSGSSTFGCSYFGRTTYVPNLYSNSPYTGGSWATYGLDKSPYECQNSITLCADCQDNVNRRCADQSLVTAGPNPNPSATYDKVVISNQALYTACTSVAKNLCPKKCTDNGAPTICANCDTSPAGISFCAATGHCRCLNSAKDIRVGKHYGQGCESLTEAVSFSVSGLSSAQKVCPTTPDIPVTLTVPNDGPGKRGLTFIGTLTNNGATTKSYSSQFTTSTATIIIPAKLAYPKTYFLAVTAEDLMDRAAESTKTQSMPFDVLPYPLTSFKIKNAENKLTVARYVVTELVTEKVANNDLCTPGCSLVGCKPTTPYVYSWSLDLAGKNVASGISAMSVAASSLQIPKMNLMPLETYTAKVAATYGADDLTKTEHTAQLYVKPSEISVTFKQGSAFAMLVGKEGIINAEVTDADELPLAYLWTCNFKNGTTFNLPGASGVTAATLKMNTVSWETGEYIFTLEVSKLNGKVKKQFTTTLTLNTLPTPTVLVKRSDGVGAYNPENYLGLTGEVTLDGAVCTGCTYVWTSGQLSPDKLKDAVLNPSLSTTDLNIKRNVLTPGSIYTFTLTASTPASASAPQAHQYNHGVGFSTITIAVNLPPSGGTLTLFSPSGELTGTAYETEMKFTTTKWVDVHTPLTYQFGYQVQGSTETLTLGDFTTATTKTITGLPLGTLYPVVMVKDAAGAVTVLKGTDAVTLSLSIPEGESVSSVMAGKLDSLLSGGDKAAQVDMAASVADSLNSDSDSSAEAAQAAEEARTKLANALEASLSDANVNPTAVMSTAASIAQKPEQLTPAAQTKLKAAMVSALDKVTKLNAAEGRTVLSTFVNVQSAAEQSSSKTAASMKAEAEAFNENLGKLLSKMSAALVPGQPPVVLRTATVETQVAKDYAAEAVKKTVGGCSLKSLTSSRRVGRRAANDVISISVIQTATAAIPFSFVPGTALIGSPMLGLTVMDSTGKRMALTKMNPPTEIEFNLTKAIKTPRCAYYKSSDSTWATDGVTTNAGTSKAAGDTVVCKSTHLTDFVVMETPAPTPPGKKDCMLQSTKADCDSGCYWTGIVCTSNLAWACGALSGSQAQCESIIPSGSCQYDTENKTCSVIIANTNVVATGTSSGSSVVIIIVVVLGVIVCLGAAVGAYFMLGKKKEETKAPDIKSVEVYMQPNTDGDNRQPPMKDSVGVGMTTTAKRIKAPEVDTKAVDPALIKENKNKSKNEAEIVKSMDIEDVVYSKTGMPLADVDKLLETYFARYDLDNSGTLNSNEELLQLTTNLCFKISMSAGSISEKKLANLTNSVQDKADSVHLDDSSFWNQAEYRQWFLDEFIVKGEW